MIAVTGGNGLIGSYLVRRLVRQGEAVRLLLRKGADTRLLGPIAGTVETVEGDVQDLYALEQLLDGAKSIVHCAALISMNSAERRTMYAVNLEGTRNMVNLALHFPGIRFVHVSSVAAIGRPAKEDAIIHEGTQWVKSPNNSHYAISKRQAEMEVWRGIAEGLEAVIVCPSTVLGAGFWNKGSLRMFEQVFHGFRFYPGGSNGFVDVRDVAAALDFILKSDITEKRLIVSGHNLSYGEVFRMIAAEFGQKPPQIQINGRLSVIYATILSTLSKLGLSTSPLTPEMARLTSFQSRYDSSNFLRLFPRFSFRPMEQTIRESAQAFLSNRQNPEQAVILPE